MTLLLAAVGATVTALLELTVGPYLRVGTAQPHLVLVLGIVVTVAVGLEAGLVWAFVGGLALDVLAQTAARVDLIRAAPLRRRDVRPRRVFVRFRPLVPIIATFVLSLVYSMILFVAFNALRAPIPVADPSRSSSRRRLRHGPGGARSGPWRSRSTIDAPTARTGRLVSTFLDDRPKPVTHLSRFLAFAPDRGHRRQRPDRAAVLPPDRRRRPPRDPRDAKNRTVLEPIPAPRGLIYDRNGRALVTNVADVRREAASRRPARRQRPEVVERLAALLGIDRDRDQRRDRRQPRLDLRPRPDRRATSTSDTARLISGGERPSCPASRSSSRRAASTPTDR